LLVVTFVAEAMFERLLNSLKKEFPGSGFEVFKTRTLHSFNSLQR
jgi:hypothetical protein